MLLSVIYSHGDLSGPSTCRNFDKRHCHHENPSQYGHQPEFRELQLSNAHMEEVFEDD